MTLEDVLFTMKIAYISRETLDSEMHRTPLDFGRPAALIGLPKTPKVLWRTKFCVSFSHKAQESIGKVGTSMHESSGEFVTAFDCTLGYHKGKANGIDDFSGPLEPEPATEYERSSLTSFNPVGLTIPNPVRDSDICFSRTGGPLAPSSPIPGVVLGELVPRTESSALGGLVPRTESIPLGGLVPLAENTVVGGLVPRTEYAVLGELPLTSTALHDFRAHEPRIRTDGLSTPLGIFVARVSATVATDEDCTGRGSISPAVYTVFASVFAIPIEGSTRSAEALAAASAIAQPTSLSRSSTQETDSAATNGSTVSISTLRGIPAPPPATTRRRTATATDDAPLL